MSKLSEAIRRAARAETPQIGFSPAPAKPRPTLLLAALGDGSKPAPGADVLLIQGGGATPDGKQAAEGQLRGLWLPDGSADTARAREQGFDFVVFGGDEAPASVLLEEEAGLVMQVQADLPDSLLQALQWMPLDALIVRWDGAITVRRQLELQRLSGFSRKPLFLFTEGELQSNELEALREAGVIGLIVDLSQSGAAARLARWRQRIDELRPRPRRSRAEPAVVSIVPSMVAAAPEPAEPDEEEE